MKILSIDTSSNICTVAILEDTNLLVEKSLDDTMNHSEKIMPTIADTLQSANLTLNDIDLIVSDKGPGSFTGIRIGTATVMAFTDSLNIQAIGISSLEALAYNEKNRSDVKHICSLIDAKNDNAYFAIYSINNGITLAIEPNCENINNIINIASNYEDIIFVGDGAEAYSEMLKNNLPNCKISNSNSLSSYSLGLAGLDAFNANRKEDILPLYLRKPQAERALENNN
ncbi:MAG: tRNA (adenosine(37)-N6)-threonylcarbamoyltransferase complex dimerization subunit type 1 TsaB [Clostridia bacterium]|nr:tRNA (adenosine(37)-N6)-threonylcarbamoyltransferase complex dimerization subunit type 1 TsaB [Clostridia bacterium]